MGCQVWRATILSIVGGMLGGLCRLLSIGSGRRVVTGIKPLVAGVRPVNWQHRIELVGFPGAVCCWFAVAYMRVEEQGNR